MCWVMLLCINASMICGGEVVLQVEEGRVYELWVVAILYWKMFVLTGCDG